MEPHFVISSRLSEVVPKAKGLTLQQLSEVERLGMMIVRNPQNRYNFHELALLLAYGKSRQHADRWANFIDNLSRISDEFASQISLKERHDLAHCNQIIKNQHIL